MIGIATRQHKDVVAFEKLFTNRASSDHDATRTSHGHGL
jgi:hypothetical protein